MTPEDGVRVIEAALGEKLGGAPQAVFSSRDRANLLSTLEGGRARLGEELGGGDGDDPELRYVFDEHLTGFVQSFLAATEGVDMQLQLVIGQDEPQLSLGPEGLAHVMGRICPIHPWC